MRYCVKKLAVCALLVSMCVVVFPQAEFRAPLAEKNKAVTAFVADFRAPYDTMLVEIMENNATNHDSLVFKIRPETKIVNRKDKPLDRQLIRPGMEIELKGEQVGSVIEIALIKLKIDHEKWEAEANGYFEGLEGDKAWVDGRAVKLNAGTMIKGKEAWKGRNYSSFNEIHLGAAVKVKGIRRVDGIIYANEVTAEPNELTGGDREMFALAQQGRLLPAKLEGGKGIVAGREVKFANDRVLQQYVTTLGNKLVPRYQKDIPLDNPARITFRFAVIEDESFNAFALPDGAIFVHTGLLKRVTNEAQLASILGHEIAHVTHEHTRKLKENPMTIWGGLGMIVGGAILGGKAGAQIGAIAANATANKYSRTAEDEADRAGLFYMTQQGYDPREATKVWAEVAKNTRSDMVGTFLFSGHSSPVARRKNLSKDIAYSYYDTDFNRTKTNEAEYLRAVGPFFGLVANTGSPGYGTTPLVGPGTAAAGSKTIAKAPDQAKINSILTFVTKQMRKPDSHGPDDVYAIVTIGSDEYFVSIKTGKTALKKTRSNSRISFSGIYADIGISTANAKMEDIGQGGGWLLKRSGATWIYIDDDEGTGYACNKTRTLPKSVIQAFSIECS